MVMRQSVCLRQLGEGKRSQEVGFGRLLSNAKVTTERVIDGWGEQTRSAVSGRHVLAIQDTSELNFRTTPTRRRGLGEIGKGVGRGLLLHAMLAIDAETGHCLGLVTGSIYTRDGRVETPSAQRAPEDRESRRWIETAQTAKSVPASAVTVTVVADRESDIYAQWASLPEANFHLLTRVMHDRAVKGGGTLSSTAAAWPVTATRIVELAATHTRVARRAELSLRFGAVEILKPHGKGLSHLPKTVPLRFVEVVERNPPDGVEPVHWRLLTTYDLPDTAAAWQIVDWYRRRWIIEQLFRLMKSHGLRIEDSQLADADTLITLTAVAAKAAAVIRQLLQARDGQTQEPADIAFTNTEIETLDALSSSLEGSTALQKNPHPRHILAWATWIIARLGGWDGYPSSKPPGPITLRNGWEYFHAIAKGWKLRDMCMP